MDEEKGILSKLHSVYEVVCANPKCTSKEEIKAGDGRDARNIIILQYEWIRVDGFYFCRGCSMEIFSINKEDE